MKIGFACGVFDIFHAGHVLMLQECKALCDYLIVAINKADNISAEINPGKRQPVYTCEERVLIMKSCKYADEVVVYNSEEELYELMKNKNVSIRFLGDDYKGKNITGSDLNIELYYTDRSHGYSTTSIIQKICKSPNKEQ